MVSVSGGCDSVALLHLLMSIKNNFKIKYEIVHFNHQKRIESNEEVSYLYLHLNLILVVLLDLVLLLSITITMSMSISISIITNININK